MKKWQHVWMLSAVLTGGSAYWLWRLKQFRESLGISEREFMSGPYAKWVWVASAGFIIGLFVVFPLSTYFEEKEEGRVGGPSVPDSWRKPAVAILYIAFAIMLLMAIGVWVAFLTGKMK